MVWALALTYLLLPFLQVGGESAFRFDVPTLRLHFFETALWVQEFYVVMLASLFSVLFFFLITLVFGRIWCGWLCPQTIISDLTDPIVRFSKHSFLAKAAAHLILAFWALSVGFSTVCYFVSPYEAIPEILALKLGPVATGSIVVIALLTYFNLVFLRRTFCATICPYAKFQGAITDNKTLKICLDEGRKDECIHCRQCLKVCPTGLDIREGMQMSCIMCAACVDACSAVMSKNNKKGLITYKFGALDTFGFAEILRPGVLALFLLIAVTFGLFSHQAFFRTAFDFNILPHSLTPRYTKAGETLNAYVLSIKNMDKKEIALSLTVSDVPDGSELKLSITEPLLIPAGIAGKFPLFIRTKEKIEGDSKITLRLESIENPKQVAEKSAYFIIPQTK
nr:4Fe-4S binding protein [Desulfobulbaceae bacterium]